MRNKFGVLVFLAVVSALLIQLVWKPSDDEFVSYTVNPKTEMIGFYYKDKNKSNFKSITNLKSSLTKDHKELVFAMNGGMYKTDKSPQGLFIENGVVKAKIDSTSADGNFYLKPNGIFYLTTKKEARVVKTETFKVYNDVNFATQSGPMLVIDGEIHKAFNRSSTNLNIRNGVGILPNGKVLFALSKKEINFYNFASFFKEKGCENALYLDGFVSRAYCPSQNWIQTDGDFGVIIAVTKNK